MKTYNILIVSLIVFASFVSSTYAQEKTLKLQVLPFSNSHFIALITTDGVLDTAAIDIKEAGVGWNAMTRDRKYGYWTYRASDLHTGLQYPLSFRLTASNNAQITLENAAVIAGVAYDTKTQYSVVKQEGIPIITNAFSTVITGKATSAPTEAPVVVVDPTAAPTNAPVAVNPTAAPTTAPVIVNPTAAPTTVAVTPVKPGTDAPSTTTTGASPTQQAPIAEATSAPTAAPTTTPTTTTPTSTPSAPTTTTPTTTPTFAPTEHPTTTPTNTPTNTPTQLPITDSPTAAPVPATQAPTQVPTQPPQPTAAPTSAPTKAPTSAPVPATAVPATVAPTQVPVAPTAAPTARATIAPTQAPAASGGCAVKPKIMVPLYVYPGAAWDALIAGAAYATTVAIINPRSGPANPPNADYIRYMQKMHDAGVDMIGYVYTQYGNRDINAVKADINVYASQYPYLKGIFLDEGAADAGKLSYYKALYDYIIGMPGWSYDVINPGIIPDSGYLSASTQIVTLENYGSEVAAHSAPSYGSCNNKEKFVAIVHTVNRDNMQSIISAINNKKYFGYIYITDGPGGCCTYNYLATYYAAQAQYIGTLSP